MQPQCKSLGFLLLSSFIFSPAMAQTPPAPASSLPPPNYACDSKTHSGEALDLTNAKMTFNDEFLRPSVTPPEGKGPWYAPVHSDFGGAKFLRPDDPRSPFFYSSGYLTIRLSQRGNKWTSGFMQTVNPKGFGFAQKYGYFEMKAKFPAGMGTWPAFWLKAARETTDPTLTRPEIDIIEAYGGRDIKGYHAGVHLWPPKEKKEGDLKATWNAGCYKRFETSLFDGAFHTYGGEVTPEWVIIYYDRKEMGRFPTLPAFQQPLFMLVDLAYNKDKEERTDGTPADLVIDYVRAWQRPAFSERR